MSVPLFLVAVAVAGLLLNSAFTGRRAEQVTSELLLAATQEQADLLTVKLEDEFTLLAALANSPDANASDFRERITADVSGKGAFSTGQAVELSEYSFYQQAVSGERVAAYVRDFGFDDGAAFVLAAPVGSGDTVSGVMIGILDERVLKDLFAQSAYSGSETYVCSEDGTVILSTEGSLGLSEGDALFSASSGASPTKQADAERIVGDIASKTQGFAQIDIGGDSWYIAYAPAAYGGWSVCRAVPSDLVDGMLKAEKAQGYFTIGTAMVSALLAALFIILLYTRAIRRSHQERERLLVAEEEYRIATKQGGMMIVRYDIGSGRIVSSSSTIGHIEIWDKAGKIDVDKVLNDIVAEESREDFLLLCRAVRTGDPSGSAEILMRGGDGQFRWQQIEFSAIGDGGGKSAQAIITARDVTAQHERTVAYKHWQNTLAASIGTSAALMEINLTTGTCERVEGEVAPLLEQDERASVQDVLARFCDTFVAKEDRGEVMSFASPERLIKLHRRGVQTDETEIRMRRADGTSRQCILTAQMADAPGADEVKAFLTLKDFENISKEIDRLSDLALRDGLSGLLNRTAARNAIEEVLLFGGGDTVALFMIDADNFKQVNDLLGHQHGDLALKQMSGVIRKMFRSTDVIARIGGDEFFVFVSEVPDENFAERKAEALCKSLRFTYAVEDRGSVSLTASIGVIVAERGRCDYERLYAEADRALYNSKKGGKNRFSIRYDGKIGAGKTISSASSGSALQLNSLMRQLDGGVVLLEIGETIEAMFISDGYFMMQGVMKEAIEAKTFPRAVIHPNDFDYVQEAMYTCAAGGEPFQVSYRNVLSSGGYGWRHMNALRVPNPSSDKPAILAVISDITELHNATEHLEFVAANSQIGIFIMRVGERIEVTFFNDGALAITGFSYEQMRIFSRDASAFFRGDNLEGFRAEVAAANAENRMVDYLYQSRGFSGKQAHNMHLYGVKLDVQNGVPSYLIIILDKDGQN